LALVVRRQQPASPFSKVGRTTPQINRNVKHFALRHTHKFALRVLNLVMQASEHALGRAAVVVLHELHIEPSCLRKVPLVEALKKEASAVTKDLGLKNQQVR
jgi:hypothetical protein